MPGFNASNPSALFPATVGLELVGSAPAGSSVAPIPGSTQDYYSGILLEGWLQSVDGSVSTSLFDADAWRLGLPTGEMVADQTYGGGAMVNADVTLSLNLAEAIFGSTGQAEFVVKNLGGAFTVGLGTSYSLANAILEPMSAANGSVMTGGYMHDVHITQGSAVPEPATLGVVGGGAAALLLISRWLRIRARPGGAKAEQIHDGD
jgi:hypothetical protein